MTTTLYEILGVEENAEASEIKEAYRIMAMKWHPDRNPNNKDTAEEKFKEASAAYKVLFNSDSRKEYDYWLIEQRQTYSSKVYESESNISEEDAEKLFFESMLDLAVEIAKHGYDAPVIAKSLMGLDCPERVANLLALSAIKINSASNKSNAFKANFTTENTNKRALKYAGFWRRFTAVLIDALIITPPFIFLQYFVTGKLSTDISSVNYWQWAILGIAGYWLYETSLLSTKKMTLGRQFLGMQVVSSSDEGMLSFGRASSRFFCKYISFLTLYIGYLIQPFTNKKQTLHDLITDSVVIQTVERGKTLIYIFTVLPVTICLLGIVAAISIPIYSDYIRRDQSSEGLRLGYSASKSVEAYYNQTAKVPPSLKAAGFSESLGEFISEVEVDPATAKIYIGFSNNAVEGLSGGYLILSPIENSNKTLSWQCNSTQIAQVNLPSGCSYSQPNGEN